MDNTFKEKENNIMNLKKWDTEYKREYQKLYYRIKLSKKPATDRDIELFNKMGKCG